ncbi:MAG TPA: prolyl oligopeptidase family serine peptidase [Isosphaeraceae bacterium]|nr:prolyl oligopeptidase family serine peptidase [Isosphaeraceae bacterium]
MASVIAAAQRGRGWRGWRSRLIRIVILVYFTLMAVLYLIQTWLIFPGAGTQHSPEAEFTPPAGTELVRLRTARGETIVALFGRALQADGGEDREAAHRPSLIYFYGNGMCLRDALTEFQMFRRLGTNVIVPEYVGYGLSTGRPSETGCYDTADATHEYLVSRPDVDASQLVAAGWSLGGAVAIDLASRHQVARLATFSTFTSMTEMAGRRYPFLPVSVLLRHRFESEAKLRNVRCPTLIGHSKDDSLVPFFMADRLAAAAGGSVSRVTISGADHSEFFAVGDRRIDSDLRIFLEGLSRTPH